MQTQAHTESPEHLLGGQEPLWTVRETARQLNLSESHVRHLIQRKELPGILRIGRAVRIRPDLLRAYTQGLLEDGPRN